MIVHATFLIKVANTDLILKYIFRLHTNNTLNGNHNINSTSQIHSVIYAQSYMIHLYLPKRILTYQNGFMKIRLRMVYHIAKMALKELTTKVCLKKNKHNCFAMYKVSNIESYA